MKEANCNDNRFEVIAAAKKALLADTNIKDSPEEMKVIDDFLFRCWQMGWLTKYDCNERFKSLDGYQNAALTTAVYPESMKINYPTLGMCGEAGEVADKVKKIYRDRNGVFTPEIRKEIMKECGDVLWYVAVLAHDLGFSLGEVAAANIAKLASRKQRGKLGGSGDNR